MKKSLLFFAGLLILLFAGCTDVDERLGRNGEGNGKLSFTLNVKGAAVNTYATVPAVGGEDEIHKLYVLFFKSSIDGSGVFLEAHDISPANDGVFRSGQTIELDLPSTSSITKTDPYNLLFIANPKFYLDSSVGMNRDWDAYFAGKTEAEVRQLRIDIHTNNSVQGDADYFTFNPYPQDNLLMTGSVSKEGGDELVTVEMTRLVSRFDVVNATETPHKLVSASVWNAFPTEILWDGSYTDFTVDRIKRLYGMELDNDEVKGGLYAYENYVAVPEQNDDLSTCLILGIEYEGEISYYRMNANQDGLSQQLRRNNVYTFNILKVKGKGENSEEDAYNSNNSLLQIQINEWNVDDQGCIVFDGDNILAISTNDVRFNRLGGNREYKVFTSGEGTLQLINKQLPSGFTVDLVDYMLYITATESDINKAGYVELQFGTLKATVRITQNGQLEEYLELSHNELPMFDNISGLESEQVTVSSSGTWTATLYNDQSLFAFASNSSGGSTGSTNSSGDDGTQFTIKTIDANNDIEAKYAFVHVVLDSNPKISAVVIISEQGMGGIQISPDGELVYTANGDYKTLEADYIVDVDTEDDEEWEVALYGANKDAFEYDLIDSNGDGIPDKVLFKAKGTNRDPLPLTAQARIYLKGNPSIYQEIKLTQEAHSLTVTPETFPVIATTGGSTDEITVTATGEWEATISATGNDAYFNGDPTISSITGSAGEETFTVTFPELTQPGVTPQVTVTITLKGTNIQKVLVITQREITGKVITLQNTNYWYGYLNYMKNDDPYRYNYVEQFYQNLINPEFFGVNGTLFCGGVSFQPYNVKPSDNTDLLIMNCFNGSTTDGATILEWLNGSKNRLILALADDRTSTLLSALRMTNYTGTGGTGNNVVKTDDPRTINTSDSYTVNTNKLYDYLLRSGPFTEGVEIQKNQIQLLPHDASNNCLTSWPSTMIPLMLDPDDSSRLLMGIDPTLRIVYLGELDIFTTKGVDSISYDYNGTLITGDQNYQGGPYSEYNMKFLNNLIAWMFNVVIQGDDFTNQFIQ